MNTSKLVLSIIVLSQFVSFTSTAHKHHSTTKIVYLICDMHGKRFATCDVSKFRKPILVPAGHKLDIHVKALRPYYKKDINMWLPSIIKGQFNVENKNYDAPYFSTKGKISVNTYSEGDNSHAVFTNKTFKNVRNDITGYTVAFYIKGIKIQSCRAGCDCKKHW